MTTPTAPATPSCAPARPLAPKAPRTADHAPDRPESMGGRATGELGRGLRAGRFFLLPHEDAYAFAALVDELRRVHAPVDAVELLYVDAIAIAIWRELRTDRLEAEAMSDVPPVEPERGFGSDLSTAAARASLATIVRYRVAAQAEHRRALAMLREHRRLRAEAEGAPGRSAQPVRPLPARHAEASATEPVAAAANAAAEPPPGPDRRAASSDRRTVAAPVPLRAVPRERDRAALEQRAKIRAQMARLAAAERPRLEADPREAEPARGIATPRPPDRRAA